MATKSNNEWIPYKPTDKIGKLCYSHCSAQSLLPIRDLQHSTCNLEPNYETDTYNLKAPCNQPSVCSAVKDGLSHILFIIKYEGTDEKYKNQYAIVGYYEIGWRTTESWEQIHGRTAIKAKRMCFVPIERAYKITDERWQRINIHGETKSLNNLRWATQRIHNDKGLLDEILQHLDRYDAVEDYLKEVEKLK